VPVRHRGEVLRAEVWADRVEIYAGEVRVAVHARSYRRGETILELGHYLPAFAKKPRAAGSCAALHQADPIFLRVRNRLLAEPGGYRLFAEILVLGLQFDLQVLAQALADCVACGRLSVEAVRQRCLNLLHVLPEPATVPEVLKLPLPGPDLACYDALMAVAP
jgi:hypothetical protein